MPLQNALPGIAEIRTAMLIFRETSSSSLLQASPTGMQAFEARKLCF